MAKTGTDKVYSVDLSKVVFPANYAQESKEALEIFQAQTMVQKNADRADVEKAYPIKEFDPAKICSEAIGRAIQEYGEVAYLSPQRRKSIVPLVDRRLIGQITLKKSHGKPFELNTDQMGYLLKVLRSNHLTEYRPFYYILAYLEEVVGVDFPEEE